MKHIAYLACTCFLLLCFQGASAQNALAFDGSDDYVLTPFFGLGGTTARTFEAWINTTSTTGTNTILDYGAPQLGRQFKYSVTSGHLQVDFSGSTLSSTTPIADGNWHHVAVSYTISSNNICFYIDGQQDTCASAPVSMNTGPGAPIHLGRDINNSDAFNGAMDEIRIWLGTRSPAEIAADWNHELCVYDVLLQAYYKCNQGIAGGSNAGENTLYDATANAFHAPLYSFALSGTSSNWVAGSGLLQPGSTSQTINPTSCGPWLSPSGNYTWTSTGTYLDTIPGANGCDSILTVNLTVATVDTSVTPGTSSLTANASLASFQWLDCNNGLSALPGDTSATFQPALSGSYAVAVTQNGCTDTSACHTIVLTGLASAPLAADFLIVPNPASDHFNLRFPDSQRRTVRLFDSLGRLISEQESGAGELQLSVPVPGMYFLRVEEDGRTRTKQVIGL